MSLLVIEGFEGAGSTNGSGAGADVRDYIRRRYIVESNTLREDASNTMRVEDGLGFGKALSWGGSSFADSNYFWMPLPAQLTECIVGFALKPQYFTVLSAPVMEFFTLAESESQVELRVQNNRDLICYNDTFNRIADTFVGNVLQPDRWVYIEIRMVMHNTAGEVEIHINGVQVLNASGLDTSGNSGVYFDAIRWRGIDGTDNTDVSQQWMIDHIYVLDTNGSENNDFLGPRMVETLFPNAEGATIDFTPSTGTDNSANVDDNPQDGDTTYNSLVDTASSKDLFECQNLSNITSNIAGVKVTSDARSESGLPVGLQSIVAEGTPTQGTGDVVEVSSDSKYTEVKHIFEQNPDTTAAWTAAEVNGMEIGYEID